jgi:hypothetical protein
VHHGIAAITKSSFQHLGFMLKLSSGHSLRHHICECIHVICQKRYKSELPTTQETHGIEHQVTTSSIQLEAKLCSPHEQKEQPLIKIVKIVCQPHDPGG